MDMRETCQMALDTWGAEPQTRMVFEEMAELQKELCKYARGQSDKYKIASEIADVLIVIEQMILLHDCRDEVESEREFKLQRLANNLKKHTERAG